MSSSPALSSVTALAAAGATITEKSLRLSRSTTWEQYEGVASFIAGIGRAYPWWVGDLLNDGEKLFGEEFAQIEALLPHSPRTCANYKSIAKWIPENRRRNGLSFSVHEAVAYLEPKERERLLDKAEANGWKRDEMRDARKAITTGEEPMSPTVCQCCGKEL